MSAQSNSSRSSSPLSPTSSAITLPDDIPSYDEVPPRVAFQDLLDEWLGGGVHSTLNIDPRLFMNQVALVLQQLLRMERNTYDHLNKVSDYPIWFIPY